jgi:Na+/H+ antiporter NhaC
VGQTASVLPAGGALTTWSEGVFRDAATGDLTTLPAGSTLSPLQDVVYFEKEENHRLPLKDAVGEEDAVFLTFDGKRLVPMENVPFTAQSYTSYTVSVGDALIMARPSISLAIGTGAALLFTLIFYILRGVFSFDECMALLPQGLRQISSILFVISFSWIFSSLLGPSRFALGDFFGDLVGGFSLGGLMPLILFVGAAAISLFCGSPLTTFAVFLPLAVSLSLQGDGTVLAVSAVLSGAVLGDQASPVSNTTILSSAGAEIGVWRHVVTQFPYVIVAFLCSAAGYLIGGLSGNGLAGLSAALGILAAMLLLYILVRIHQSRKHSEL